MRNSECDRFEDALLAEAEIDERTDRHAEECPRCRALAGVTGLSVSPVVAREGDAFVTSVHAMAAQMAGERADRWERRRRLVPFLIGLAGYLTASLTAISVLLSDGNAGRVVPQASETYLPALPAPQPVALAAVFAAAAVWIAAVAFLTRSRRPVLEPNTPGPEP